MSSPLALVRASACSGRASATAAQKMSTAALLMRLRRCIRIARGVRRGQNVGRPRAVAGRQRCGLCEMFPNVIDADHRGGCLSRMVVTVDDRDEDGGRHWG